MDKLSVVVPAYNEVRRLKRNIKLLSEHLDQLGNPYEIIITEDGSIDDTYDVANELSEEISQVRVIHSEKRLGKGGALNKALRHIRGDLVVIMDADLATDLKHMPELVRTAKEVNGVALGSRMIRGARVRRPLIRRMASMIYNKLADALFKTGIKDHQCGFKAFTKSVVDDVLPNMHDLWWAWDTEFIVRARKAGYPVVEIAVTWRAPKKESSILKIAPRMTSEVLRLIALRCVD